MADRRTFLSGLISLPLIGGGVTLIGRPAAAVPLVQAAALPSLDDPRQRARYAWEAFSTAMRDLTADADGWVLHGAGERYRDLPGFRGGRFLIPAALHIQEHRNDPMAHPFYSERQVAFDLYEEVRR